MPYTQMYVHMCAEACIVFHDAFLCLLRVCIIAFDMFVLREAMLICLLFFSFFKTSVYHVYIAALAR